MQWSSLLCFSRLREKLAVVLEYNWLYSGALKLQLEPALFIGTRDSPVDLSLPLPVVTT